MCMTLERKWFGYKQQIFTMEISHGIFKHMPEKKKSFFRIFAKLLLNKVQLHVEFRVQKRINLVLTVKSSPHSGRTQQRGKKYKKKLHLSVKNSTGITLLPLCYIFSYKSSSFQVIMLVILLEYWQTEICKLKNKLIIKSRSLKHAYDLTS